MGFEVTVLDRIADLDTVSCKQLDGHGNPFLSTRFLGALERSGSVGQGTGWIPHHLLLTDNGRSAAFAPSYVKSHSYGEFVFDWAWAEAYARAGMPYYPKLVSCIPFTPATGPRVAIAPGYEEQRREINAALAQAASELCEREGYSSHHVLFEDRNEAWTRAYAQRISHQYHWQNRGYETFDGWLSALRSSKRKQIRKERRRLHEAGVYIRPVPGLSLQDRDWAILYALYQQNAVRHGSPAYLSESFWLDEMPALADDVLVFAGYRGTSFAPPQAEDWLGASICFAGSGQDRRLYGRYWGARTEVPFLHFACAYYEPVNWCIANERECFEAGAQGEHKFLRGFVAEPTYSSHWCRDPHGHQAISGYLEREREDRAALIKRYNALSPDKKARSEAG